MSWDVRGLVRISDRLRQRRFVRLLDANVPEVADYRSPNIHHHPWLVFRFLDDHVELVVRHSLGDSEHERKWASDRERYWGRHVAHGGRCGSDQCGIDLDGFFESRKFRAHLEDHRFEGARLLCEEPGDKFFDIQHWAEFEAYAPAQSPMNWGA